MIGIYILATIFSQFSPPALFPSAYPFAPFVFEDVFEEGISGQTSEVELVVDQLNGVRVGTPVALDGEIIGSVKQIQGEKSKRAVKTTPRSFNLKLAFEVSGGLDLRSGAIGIITSPISRLTSAPQTVVELINPKEEEARPALKSGEKLRGFGSLSDFWASPSELSIL